MKLSISRQAFLTALEIGGQVCGTTSIPATKFVKIKFDTDRVVVTSTNIEMFVSKRVDIDYAGEPMEFCVDLKNILPVLKTIKDATVDMDIDNSHIFFKHQKGEIDIPVYPSDSFPMPKVVGDARIITVDASFFVASLKKAVKFADKGKGLDRPSLRAVYCYLKDDDFKITATDGHALFMTKMKYTGDKSQLQNGGVLIPANSIPVLTSMIPLDGEITIKDRENNFFISVDGCSVFVTKLTEKYPPVEQIIPTYSCHTSVPTKEFYEAVSRCALLTNKVGSMISMSINGGMIDLQGEDIDFRTKSKEFLLTQGNLDNLKVLLSASFLSTIIKEIDDDNMEIYAYSGDRSIIFKANGNENTIFLLMPMQTPK